MEDLVPPAVLTELLSLQSALQLLLVAFQKITYGLPVPSAIAPKSRARNLRRQAMLRKLYAAAAHSDTVVAVHDKAIQACDGDAVMSVSCRAVAPLSLSEVDDKQLRSFSMLPPLLRVAPVLDVTASSFKKIPPLALVC